MGQYNNKLAPLLYNQDDEENHHSIIQQNAHGHILFGTGLSSRKKGKVKFDQEKLKAAVQAMPLKQRLTTRYLSHKVGVLQSSIQHFLKPPGPWIKIEEDDVGVVLRRHSSAITPKLLDGNMLSRFIFAKSQINPATMLLRSPKFLPQFNKVHIDKEWFHLCQDGERYILDDGEAPPVQKTKHKGYIEKVMFLCAQARPRWGHTTNQIWDGKLGIWPIGVYKIAQSVNRLARTQEWKNESVDRSLQEDADGQGVPSKLSLTCGRLRSSLIL
jgi:hypothetical protein